MNLTKTYILCIGKKRSCWRIRRINKSIHLLAVIIKSYISLIIVFFDLANASTSITTRYISLIDTQG